MLSVRSRRGRQVGPTYPELSGYRPRPPLVLDGEIVVLDDRGHPSFQMLQSRMNLTDGRRASIGMPASYMVFDLLHDGEDLTGMPLEYRRERLASLALPAPMVVSTQIDGAGEALYRGGRGGGSGGDRGEEGADPRTAAGSAPRIGARSPTSADCRRLSVGSPGARGPGATASVPSWWGCGTARRCGGWGRSEAGSTIGPWWRCGPRLDGLERAEAHVPSGPADPGRLALGRTGDGGRGLLQAVDRRAAAAGAGVQGAVGDAHRRKQRGRRQDRRPPSPAHRPIGVEVELAGRLPEEHLRHLIAHVIALVVVGELAGLDIGGVGAQRLDGDLSQIGISPHELGCVTEAETESIVPNQDLPVAPATLRRSRWWAPVSPW